MLRQKLEKIVLFIDQNRVLSLVLVLTVILVTLVFIGKKTTPNEVTPVQSTSLAAQGYATLLSSPSFEYYKYLDKYYVLIKDSTTQDKEKIRQYLKIPQNIDFEVVIKPNLDPISRADFWNKNSGSKCCD